MKRSEIAFYELPKTLGLTRTWNDQSKHGEVQLSITKCKSHDESSIIRIRYFLSMLMENSRLYSLATNCSRSFALNSLIPKSSLSLFSLHTLPYSLLSP